MPVMTAKITSKHGREFTLNDAWLEDNLDICHTWTHRLPGVGYVSVVQTGWQVEALWILHENDGSMGPYDSLQEAADAVEEYLIGDGLLIP